LNLNTKIAFLDLTTKREYIYRKVGNNWTFAQKLLPGGGITGDGFGSSVAVKDGVIAVGAPGDNQLGNDAGAVYVFRSTNLTSWTQTQKIVAYDGILQDEFGCSVSIDDNKLAVGSRYSNVPGTPPVMFANAGAVYVYHSVITPPSTQPTFTNLTKLTASDRQMNDFLGQSVAISGNKIIAGAFGDEDYGVLSGSAYIFGGLNFETQTKLNANNATQGDHFGWSVAISQNTALVGAIYKNLGDGAAYVFNYNGTTWTQFGAGLAPTMPGSTTGQFGNAVAISNNTAIVGAFQDTQNGTNAGAAYFYQFLAQPVNVVATDGVFEQYVQIGWTPHPTTSATSYTIFKYKEGNLIATFANAPNPYNDPAVGFDTLYSYCVVANHPIWGQSQAKCDIGYKGSIASPANFTASDNIFEDRIVLNWQNVSLLSGQPNPKCVGGIIRDSVIVRKNGGIIDTIPGTTNTYTDFSVFSTIEYDYCLQQYFAEYDSIFNIKQTIYDLDTTVSAVTSLNDPNQPYLRILDTLPGLPPTYQVETLDTNFANTTYLYDTLVTRRVIASAIVCDKGMASIKKPLTFAATYPFNGAVFNVDFFENRVALSWTKDLSSINTGYRIYRNGDLLVTINNPNIFNYDDFDALSNQIYEYCLVAYHVTLGESEAFCEFGGNRIRPPATITATDGAFENRVVLNWTMPTSSVAQGIRIYRDSVLIATRSVFLPPTYTDFDVQGLNTYTYCIEAYHFAWGASTRICDSGFMRIVKPTFTSITNGTPNHEDKIVLNWSNGSNVATGYRIYRNSALLTTINNPATLTYTDQSNITSLQSYEYQIESFSPVLGDSERSTGTGMAKIKSPTNVQATDGTFANKVTITWADGSSLPGRAFRIYRNGFLIATRPQGTTSYEDLTVNSQSIYQYCVLTFKTGLGESDPNASCDSGSTQTAPPPAAVTSSSSVKLIPSISGAFHYAGYSVAISGNTIAMGAPGNPGNVFVFKGENGGVWTQSAVLAKPSETFPRNTSSGGNTIALPSITNNYQDQSFGQAVAINATANRIVVGVPGAFYWGPAINQAVSAQNGAVMVYNFNTSSNTWTHAHTKKPSDLWGLNTLGYEYFGQAVTIDGEWVGIGSSGRQNGGAAYRYNANTNSALIAYSSTGGAYNQGTSVMLFNNGANILAGDPGAASFSGRVWQSGINGFLHSGSNLEGFGGSIARFSNNEVLVGARSNNTGAPNSGAVYVSNYNQTGIINPGFTIKAPTPLANDYFGSSVAVSGNRAVIGAPENDDNGSNTGAVYVYERKNGLWQFAAKLLAPGNQNNYD
ncbi:MAG TPA: FG-GAP repeat protein, partial [Chitinophagales bacterium]|nr:FG-GAP repeat protein [Chitinophagales bacterium]HRK29270.1 FG-GAP repeat protein [Chitinophagales bacterium]